MQSERRARGLWSLILIALSAAAIVVAGRSTHGAADPGPPPDAVAAPVVVAAVQEPAVSAVGWMVPTVSRDGVQVVIPPAVPGEVLAQEPRAWPAQLSESDMRELLTLTGWPEWLQGEAIAVACGIGNRSGFPSGESNCHPGSVGDGGNSVGLFQLGGGTWAPYCGVPAESLLDPETNAACAYRVYLYDVERGQAPWQQWTVKP